MNGKSPSCLWRYSLEIPPRMVDFPACHVWLPVWCKKSAHLVSFGYVWHHGHQFLGKVIVIMNFMGLHNMCTEIPHIPGYPQSIPATTLRTVKSHVCPICPQHGHHICNLSHHIKYIVDIPHFKAENSFLESLSIHWALSENWVSHPIVSNGIQWFSFSSKYLVYHFSISNDYNFPILPSGKRLHNYGKSHFLMAQLTISIAIFNNHFSHYQRVYSLWYKTWRCTIPNYCYTCASIVVMLQLLVIRYNYYQ